jgi:apolipoprotein N-acyltransferase
MIRPPAGCPLYAPAGTHGLWYVSPDGQYWCLNTARYYGDVLGAPGHVLGSVLHALLMAVLALAYLAVIACLIYLGTFLAGRWIYARWCAWRFARTGSWPRGLVGVTGLNVYRPGGSDE